MVAFRRSLRCGFQVFLRSNVIPSILIDFEVRIGMSFILMSNEGYFLARVNVMH